MWNLQGPVMELKVRPFTNPNNQERPDQRGASRVHVCREVLLELKMDSGQPCYLWKTGECLENRRSAIAWLTSERSLSKKVVQLSKAFQDACGFRLGDDLGICAAGERVNVGQNIVLKDITALENDSVHEIAEEDRQYWEWFMREHLGRAEAIFPGMIFRNISLRGPRRTFEVLSVNGSLKDLIEYVENSSVTISGQAEEFPSSHSSGKLELNGIAGIDQAVEKLNRFFDNFGRVFKFTWAQRSCAVILHGSHGTGKTFLLSKVAKTGWGKVHKVDKDMKPVALRKLFQSAKSSRPSMVVMDDIDVLLAQDHTSLSDISSTIGEELDLLIEGQANTSLPQILVIAATSDVSKIPSSLRTRGRFRVDITLPIPDASARKSILRSLSPPLAPQFRDEVLNRLGDRTHAYTAEDLVSLLDVACDIAEDRSAITDHQPGEEYFLEQDDIEQALLHVRPTAMHDITLKPPIIRWGEIGGQDNVKKALRRAVETPLLHPGRMLRLGATAKKGLLLYGPPGCSKTLSAQALATEAGLNFFAVKGAELLNMYVGESERAVREIFARARAASPSIIFFDEIESIGGRPEKSGVGGNGVNVLTTLLNEMDGIETLKGVTVLAATNQPQALDSALLRPGRFDLLLYVAPPDLRGREEILRGQLGKMDCEEDVMVEPLARLTEGYSGAEIVGVCQSACDAVLERCEDMGREEKIAMADLVAAIGMVKKQITPKMVREYERWREGLGTD